MEPVVERLRRPGVLLADGAMGTMLLRRGLKPGECPERCNLERPRDLEEIASLYFEAGAELIQTNTFGASPLKLEPYGLAGATEEINLRAVKAVRTVVGESAYVYGSCGPSGRILEPYGDATEEEVYASFRRQMSVLIGEGVDLICVETMSDPREATLAIRAARDVSFSIPVCATLTFDETPRGFMTLMGASIPQVIGELTGAGANIIGSNCGNGIRTMVRIAGEFVKGTSLPVAIQSNAGIPVLKDGVSLYPDSPEFMAEQSRFMITAGVKIIGGCCGTTPGHIAALRSLIDHQAPG
jgi:5-methyltetrahydrofolate--homocysteine methyltransferase